MIAVRQELGVPVTEQEFLASEDPAAMLRHWTAFIKLSDKDDRKLRLFACACCRQAWHLLTDERLRRAVEVAERFADGAANENELKEAHGEAYFGEGAALEAELAWAVTMGPGQIERHLLRYFAGGHVRNALRLAALLRCIVGNPFRPATLPRPDCLECGNTRQIQAGQIDCPYCPCPWLTPDVLAVARLAYEDRREDGTLDPERLAVLSDALEEAGCVGESVCPGCDGVGGWSSSAGRSGGVGGQTMTACSVCQGETVVPIHPLLAHLRSPGPHYRGCWALDLILGKS